MKEKERPCTVHDNLVVSHCLRPDGTTITKEASKLVHPLCLIVFRAFVSWENVVIGEVIDALDLDSNLFGR